MSRLTTRWRARVEAFSIVLPLVLALMACVEPPSTNFWTSDAAYMQQFKERLEQAGIPFTVDENGHVSWSGDHSETATQIRMNLELQLYSGQAVRFEPEDGNRYFRKLLDERNLAYIVEQRPDGDWTRWYPAHEAQAEELRQLVTMFVFEKSRAAVSTDCNDASHSARPAAEISVAGKESQTPSSC